MKTTVIFSIVAALIVPVCSVSVLAHSNLFSFTKHVETVLVGVKGPLSTTDSEIFTNAWKSAFNALHDSNQATVTSVMIENEQDFPESSLNTKSQGYLRAPASSLVTDDYWSTYIVLQLDLEGHCLGCLTTNEFARFEAPHGEAVASETDPAMLKRRFEMDLCVSLRTSSATAFKDISECIVNYHSQTDPTAVENRSLHDDVNSIEIDEVVQTIILGIADHLSEKDARIFNEVWMQTYNEMHDEMTQVESVSVVGEDMHHGNAILAGTAAKITNLYLWLSIHGRCRSCTQGSTLADDVTPPRALLKSLVRGSHNPAIIHRQFEKALCNNLATKSVAAFSEINDCIVEFHPSTSAPAVERAEEVKIILLGSTGQMNEGETAFMDECVKMTYNSMHQSTVVDIESVSLESQEYHGPADSSPAVDGKWNIKYSAFQFYVSGRCHLCDPSDGNQPFLPPLLSLLASNSDVDTLVLHRVFEKTLCNELRAGPFDYFRGITDCVVSFAFSGRLDAAASV